MLQDLLFYVVDRYRHCREQVSVGTNPYDRMIVELHRDLGILKMPL